MRRFACFLSLISLVSATSVTAYAMDGGAESPAVTLNYTQSNIHPEGVISTLVKQVNGITPTAKYHVVGYQPTVASTGNVAPHVREVATMLMKNGVDKSNIQLWTKESDLAYHKVEVFVRN
jgi:polysaccharide pyruvyl transferase WcaK-like protein